MTVYRFTETPQSLTSFLEGCRDFSETFMQSKDQISAFKLGNILALLHQKRLCVPDDLKGSVIKTIFQIHDKALYSSNPLTKQQAQIATITGFFKGNIGEDINVIHQILNRFVLADYTKGMLPTAKKLIPKILDLYLARNYQLQDNNLSLANKLKFLIQSIDNCQSKKNVADKCWLYENAQKLARISPTFQSFADQYQQPVKRQRTSLFAHHPYCLGEAVETYNRPSFYQTNFSRE